MIPPTLRPFFAIIPTRGGRGARSLTFLHFWICHNHFYSIFKCFHEGKLASIQKPILNNLAEGVGHLLMDGNLVIPVESYKDDRNSYWPSPCWSEKKNLKLKSFIIEEAWVPRGGHRHGRVPPLNDHMLGRLLFVDGKTLSLFICSLSCCILVCSSAFMHNRFS